MNESIDKGIQNLNYDPEELLAFKGESDLKYIPEEGYTSKEGTFVIVRREKADPVHSSTFDIAIPTAVASDTYPGALLLANHRLTENVPDTLPAKRAPLRLRISLPMGSDGSVTVDNPKYSYVSDAIDQMLAVWYEKYADQYTGAASFTYREFEVHSEDQLTAQLGCNFEAINAHLNVDFNAISSGSKRAFLLEFKQIFYTVSIDAPSAPSGFFDDDVTWEQLVRQGVNDQNPPAYVASTAYGRMIYVKLETESQKRDIDATLKAAYKDDKVDLSVFNSSVFNGCSFTAVVMGGDAASSLIVTTKDFTRIQELIQTNGVFGPRNQGLPVSYKAVLMKGNVIAKINSQAEYVVTTSQEHSNGILRLEHKGGYAARFEVTYKLHHFVDGADNPEPYAWPENGKSRTAPFQTEIELPANAFDIHVKAEGNTGLSKDKRWRIAFERDVQLAKKVIVTIAGTTLNQKGAIQYIYD